MFLAVHHVQNVNQHVWTMKGIYGEALIFAPEKNFFFFDVDQFLRIDETLRIESYINIKIYLCSFLVP